jgi:hypothetical protein
MLSDVCYNNREYVLGTDFYRGLLRLSDLEKRLTVGVTSRRSSQAPGATFGVWRIPYASNSLLCVSYGIYEIYQSL